MSDRPQAYKLDGRTVVPCTWHEWAEWFEGLHGDVDARRVALTRVGDVTVSTVFLGLDHNFDLDGPPLIFETMVFGGPHDDNERRYSTWDEAWQGHFALVERERAAAHGAGLPRPDRPE